MKMKTGVLRIGIVAGILLGSAIVAPADLITFQVNMGVQAALGTFDPATMNVECRGNFQSPVSFVAGFVLTNTVENPDVYMNTYNVTNVVAPATRDYKFTYNNGVYELQGSANRTVQLTGSPQTLPVIYFDDVTSAVANSITFQVNMSARIGLGLFNPDSDYMTVAGPFRLASGGGWDATACVLTNIGNNIYAGAFEITNGMGKMVAHKFTINGGGTWEGNVGPGGTVNRVYMHTNQPTPLVLPVVFFNNLGGAFVTNSITFQVNMGVQSAYGTNFTPGDYVVVAGSFNDWSPTTGVLTDMGNNIWAGTYDAIGSSNVSTTVSYQFVINGTRWENDLYATGNRALTFLTRANTNQTNSVLFFGNVADLGPLSAGSVSEGQTTLTWNPGMNVRLQNSTNVVSGPWQDVLNTQGEGTNVVNVVPGQTFFRLTGP